MRVLIACEYSRGIVLTKAVLRASDRLGMNAKQLARAVGLSEPTISRMKRGDFTLDENSKQFELAALLVRAYRSLDAISGGEGNVIKAWLKAPNSVLGGIPADKIITISGLIDVITYLDSRRDDHLRKMGLLS